MLQQKWCGQQTWRSHRLWSIRSRRLYNFFTAAARSLDLQSARKSNYHRHVLVQFDQFCLIRTAICAFPLWHLPLCGWSEYWWFYASEQGLRRCKDLSSFFPSILVSLLFSILQISLTWTMSSTWSPLSDIPVRPYSTLRTSALHCEL